MAEGMLSGWSRSVPFAERYGKGDVRLALNQDGFALKSGKLEIATWRS